MLSAVMPLLTSNVWDEAGAVVPGPTLGRGSVSARVCDACVLAGSVFARLVVVVVEGVVTGGGGASDGGAVGAVVVAGAVTGWR